MKNLLLLSLVLFFPKVTLASQCNSSTSEETVEEQLEIKTGVPNHLKGATIIIRLADGRESQVPAEKFKVVPRKQQFIVIKTKQFNKLICGPEKNRVSLLVGDGLKKGLSRHNTPTTVTVKSRVGTIGGVQYQRLVSDKISLGVQVQTNESALIGIGLDF